MKLWLVVRTDYEDMGYDESHGFVIRAESDMSARKIASESCGDEGTKVWLEMGTCSCTQLTEKGPEGVMLRDYLAG